VVGERWTLLLVRNLLLGPQRYNELLRGLPGITTNLLAKRLKELEEADIVEHIRLSATDQHGAYRLTQQGLALEPAIHALGNWGQELMCGGPSSDDHKSFEWFLVSLKRRYAGGEDLNAELVVAEVPYFVNLRAETIEAGRGPAVKPQITVRGSAIDVIEWLAFGEIAGVAFEGKHELVERFANAFQTNHLAQTE